MAEYRVPAVHSAHRLLEYLAGDQGHGASQTELARACDLSKSTAFALLATLEDLGWVRRDQARRYRLGPTLIGLGGAAARGVNVMGLAAEALAGLPDRLGLSFAVAYLTSDGDAQVAERLYPSVDEHVGVAIGARYGDRAGALGKAVLALHDDDEVRIELDRVPLHAHTERSITDPELLLADVRAARDRGWSASEGELNDNHAVVGFAPSADPRQQVFLLALGFPSQLPPAAVQEVGDELARLARDITRRAGLDVSAPDATAV